MSAVQAMSRGLRMTTTFSGRDTPGQFWPYAGAVLAGFVVVGFVLQIVAVEGGASSGLLLVMFAVTLVYVASLVALVVQLVLPTRVAS